MNREQKINLIKYILQRIGDRDDEGFKIEVVVKDITWSLRIGYNYDIEGDEIDTLCTCHKGSKMVVMPIYKRTDDELTDILYKLNLKMWYGFYNEFPVNLSYLNKKK